MNEIKQEKVNESGEIEAQIQAFLERGGTIQQIPRGYTEQDSRRGQRHIVISDKHKPKDMIYASKNPNPPKKPKGT